MLVLTKKMKWHIFSGKKQMTVLMVTFSKMDNTWLIMSRVCAKVQMYGKHIWSKVNSFD